MILNLLFSLIMSSTAAVKIAIDPGHGGTDNGAVYSKVRESKIALQISKLLYKELKKNKKFKPYLLRENNSDMALEKRVSRSEKLDIDLFVSIHANSNTNKNIKGTEFYIQSQMPIEEESLFLANRENNHDHKKAQSEQRPKGPVESILFDLEKTQRILESYKISQNLRKVWPESERKQKRYMIRQGPFYVLSQTQIPAVLVEVGYLSHTQDRKKLVDPSYQRKLAKRIYRGLLSYVKSIDK